MVFYMPEGSDPAPLDETLQTPGVDDLTPRRVVEELDRFIVGQAEAKRAVAVALRNRWRRRQLPNELADEVLPKNILMIGPTGVGKTEIARRLARLTGSPFLKVEATKFTEVGYVGRDCESMVRDLVELSLQMTRARLRRDVAQAASRAVEDRLLDALAVAQGSARDADGSARGRIEAREDLRKKLRSGELESQMIEIDVPDTPSTGFKIAGGPGMDEIDIKLGDMMPGFGQGRLKKKRVSVDQARVILQEEEENQRLDEDKLKREAIRSVEQTGIIFIDEIDKVATGSSQQGPDVSRQGVQRDLLPIVEGTIVQTKHGSVRTDHILFVAAGAFHVSKPSDLIPELQGRFPIRVELQRLTQEDLVRILREPENSLIKQYQALLRVDGVQLAIEDDAIEEIARLADQVNRSNEDIGARRLATILERLLEPILFGAPEEHSGETRIRAEDVSSSLAPFYEKNDLARFVL